MNEQQFEEFMAELKNLVNSVAEIAAAFEAETVLPSDDEPVPPILGDGLLEVFVTADKSPLREVVKTNKKGVGVLGIYGKADMSKRIVAKKGKELTVFPSVYKFDGGHIAYKLPTSQVVDGNYLPGDQYLYVLARHVMVK